MVATIHAVVKSSTSRAEGAGHILYVDNFFSSQHLFDDLHTKVVTYCGTVRQNFKKMLGEFDSNDLEGRAVRVQKNLLLLNTTADTSATVTRGSAWLIAIQLENM